MPVPMHTPANLRQYPVSVPPFFDLFSSFFKNLFMSCCLVVMSCLILHDLMDCSPPGSSVPRISQARILEWLAISNPGDLPNPGIKPTSPVLAGRLFTTEPPGKPPVTYPPHYYTFLSISLFSNPHLELGSLYLLFARFFPDAATSTPTQGFAFTNSCFKIISLFPWSSFKISLRWCIWHSY